MNSFLALPIAILAIGTSPACAATQEGTWVASLVSVTRLVRVQDAEGGDFKAAKAGMKLKEGMIVRTLEKSMCEISFTPAHYVRLGPSGKMKISRIGRKEKSARILIRLITGRIRALIDRNMREEADFGIYGATTLTAVKGTDYDMIREDDDKVTVLVNEGKVSVTEVESEDLEQIEKMFVALLLGNIGFPLREGKMLNIIPGQPFPIPIPIPKGFPSPWGSSDHDDKPGLPTKPSLPGLPGLGFP